MACRLTSPSVDHRPLSGHTGLKAGRLDVVWPPDSSAPTAVCRNDQGGAGGGDTQGKGSAVTELWGACPEAGQTEGVSSGGSPEGLACLVLALMPENQKQKANTCIPGV